MATSEGFASNMPGVFFYTGLHFSKQEGLVWPPRCDAVLSLWFEYFVNGLLLIILQPEK